jgi:hypothetical protein
MLEGEIYPEAKSMSQRPAENRKRRNLATVRWTGKKTVHKNWLIDLQIYKKGAILPESLSNLV